MRSLIGTPNQVYTKKIGESFLILRSAWESNLGEGIDAAGVTLDEKDRMKPGVEVAFKESLSSSAYGWIREVSTPTLPGRGVDASWQNSDQQHWMVKCEKCGMEQTISYPDNIVEKMDIPLGCKELPEGAYEYACKKKRCRGPLDRIGGRWVAARPSVKNIRGYHIPQTIAAWISATKVMQKKIDYKFIQLWMNYVLGETSMGDNIMLTDEDFEMANAGHQLQWRRTSEWPIIAAGIDWGHRNWVNVIGLNSNGRCYQLNTAMFEDSETAELSGVRKIDAFLEPFEPDIIVGDYGYGKDRNAYLLRKYGEGRFFACQYNRAEKGGRTFTPVWSNDRVLVDRTMSLKVMCRAIKERELGFCDRSLPVVQLIEDHFKALVPMKEEDEDGEIVEIIQPSGDDHLAHACLYAWLGLDRLTSSSRFNFTFV
jgi:aromatic ring-cleaving dioxygenase